MGFAPLFIIGRQVEPWPQIVVINFTSLCGNGTRILSSWAVWSSSIYFLCFTVFGVLLLDTRTLVSDACQYHGWDVVYCLPEGFTGWSRTGSVGRKMRLGFMGPTLWIPRSCKGPTDDRSGSCGRKRKGILWWWRGLIIKNTAPHQYFHDAVMPGDWNYIHKGIQRFFASQLKRNRITGPPHAPHNSIGFSNKLSVEE